MLEILLFCIFGCITGIAIGVLPGMANSIAMVIFYPLLIKLGVNNILSFYIGMITCTQYFGGASATLLGIPTEASCLPSVKEGFGMTQRGAASDALSSGAISSFVGSCIALVLSLVIFYLGNNYSLLYNFGLQFTILAITCLITICSSRNALLASISMLLFGYFIGMIGMNPITREPFFTFGNPYLLSGIPVIIVLVFLYSLPSLIMLPRSYTQFSELSTIKYKFILPVITTIRSSIIGFLCGFIPMLGIVISSNLSYSVERFLNRKNYNDRGDIKALVSSDAAHNAGIVGSLIPLFCFAIPITASEYILFDITTYRGLVYNLQWLTTNFYWLFAAFLIANMVGVAAAWPFAIRLLRIITAKIAHFSYLGIALLLSSIVYLGYTTHQLYYYALLSMVFFPLGFLLRKLDLLPLLLGFMLAEQFDSVTRIVYSLYIKG
jgi:putative tricarboxylic transport membrane protein